MLIADWFMENLSLEKHYVSKLDHGTLVVPAHEYAGPFISNSIGII